MGAAVVERASMVAFAALYDPQPFHLDEAAAQDTIFGGLVASGLQTIAVVHGLAVRSGVLERIGGLAGVGMEQVRFLRPVRPGDCLHGTAEALAITPSRSQPGRGIARCRFSAVNQSGDMVISYEMSALATLANWT